MAAPRNTHLTFETTAIRDFTITNAERLLASARATYIELNPGTTEQDATELVTSASDAIFTLLQHDGLLGDAVYAQLASYGVHGLELGGWREQVTVNERATSRAGRTALTRATSSRCQPMPDSIIDGNALDRLRSP